MAKRQIVFFLGLSFILGTLAAGNGVNFFVVLGLLAGFIGTFLFLKSRKDSFLVVWKSFRFVGILSLLCLFAGFFYFYFFLNLRNQAIEIGQNSEVVFTGIVVGDPDTRENYQLLDVSLLDPLEGKVKVLASVFPKFEYGDELKVRGVVEESRFQNDWPVVFYPQIELVGVGRGFWLKEKLVEFKNGLTGKLPQFFSSDQSALLAGLTFGERGDFSAVLKEDMGRAGVTHIVALSGYNIAILALAIERAFSYFLSRRKRFYLTLVLIFIFVLMVGGEASVVRAAIMGALALVAQHVGRPHDVLHLVVLTAVGMILIDPTITAYNLGFQLSFLSLLGILLIEPALRKLFRFKEQKSESFLSWKENGLTTVSAQLAVLPVLVVNFDYFSITSVLANILILFTVPLTMFLGFLLVALASISTFLGFFVAKIVSILLIYQISVIKLFSFVSIPFGNFNHPILIYMVSYGALLVLILYSRKYEKI